MSQIDVDSLDLNKYELLDIATQQGLPESVKECEKSVREDNPDMDTSTAIAICRDQLDLQDEGGCPEGQVNINGNCVTVETVEAPPSLLSSPNVFQLASDLSSEPIERVEHGDNTVRYNNLKALSPGMWTDSASREQLWYSPEGISNLDVADDAHVDIMHDVDLESGEPNEPSAVGEVVNAEPDTEGNLFVDIELDTSKPGGEFADENLQTALESGGTVGFGGPSVEIDTEPDDVRFNSERGINELVGGTLEGMALVANPASKSVAFSKETARRAVALSSGQSDLYVHGTHSDMAIDASELADQLGIELSETDIELQDDIAIQDIMGLVADSLGVEVSQVMDQLSQIDEAELQEEDEEDEEDEEMPDETDEDDEDDVEINMEEEMQNLRERLESLEDQMDAVMRAENLGEELEDHLEELADEATVEELAEAKEELETQLSDATDRIEALEAEPKDPKTLADGANTEENGAEVRGPISEIEPAGRY